MQTENYTIIGYTDDPLYQKCKEAADFCRINYPDEYNIVIKDILAFEFEKECADYITRGKLQPQKHQLLPSSIRVIAINYIDSSMGENVDNVKKVLAGEEFLVMILKETDFRLFNLPDDDPKSYCNLARVYHRSFLKSTNCCYTWMNVTINGANAGRIIFQLFSSIAPRTCLNFIHLCRGDLPNAFPCKDDALFLVNGVMPLGQNQEIKLHYKGTNFYRVVRNGWIQGGDVTGKGGNGGYSAFGRFFPDESHAVKHDAVGILGMVNDGEHTNSSSFYITLQKSQWMDNRYVAFGRVVKGLEIINSIASVPVKHNQSPRVPIIISDCGEIEL